MEIKSGITRIVLLLPSLGVAIKFPRIRVLRTLRVLWQIVMGTPEFRSRRLASFLEGSSGRGETYGLRPFLFGGIHCNRSEYRFYRRTRNAFVWPTTFSFFGLLNVQPIGFTPSRNWDDVWKTMVDVANRDIMKDPHTFYEAHNFCEDSSGKIYLLDYASWGSRWVLRQYGAKFRERL